MELYIQIKNGQPFEHPIFEDNFRQAFPHIDTDNLPPEFSKFIRIQPPAIKLYEVSEVTYERVDGVYQDTYTIREMTSDEKLTKQNIVKEEWGTISSQFNVASWIFNEDACQFVPPIPMPIDGQDYTWDETTTSWIVR